VDQFGQALTRSTMSDAKSRSDGLGCTDKNSQKKRGDSLEDESKATLDFRADSKDGCGSLSSLQEKHRAVEIAEERDVEDEFEALMLKGREEQGGGACIAQDPLARKKALGFRIISMCMRDTIGGEILWQQNRFDVHDMFAKEMEERIPKSILSCKAVSREIQFSSTEELKNLRIEQRVLYCGSCIEQWFFTFGFVIPGSTNSWQQVIEAAPPDKMLPAESLNGNITFETAFYDGSSLMGKNLVRIFYF